jgi:predicted ATPase
VSALRSIGSAQFLTQFLGLLAHAQLKRGRIDEARRTTAEGLDLVERTGEQFYHAELLRLEGELLLASRGDGARGESEIALVTAMDIARSQHAGLFQLRAATSFGCLIGDDRPDEARRAIATALDAVPEGRDVPDITRAIRLVHRLAADP